MKTVRYDELQGAAVPATDIEWLMMREGDAPARNDSHNKVVADALTRLSEESQWILHAIFFERTTYQELGDRLGVSKPHAWRLTQRAIEQLKSSINNHTTITGRYGMEPTWDKAAADALDELLDVATEPPLAGEAILGWQKIIAKQFDDRHFNWVSGTASLARQAWARLLEEGDITREGLVALLARKQHDYGTGNILAFGQQGIIVRLSDKLNRLDNLLRRDHPSVVESVLDTLCDIVGYCVISSMLYLGWFELPLEADAA